MRRFQIGHDTPYSDLKFCVSRAIDRGATMPRKTEIADRIVDAALELAAEPGWGAVSLADIAARAGLSLADLRQQFASKAAIVAEFLARIDAEALGAAKPLTADQSPRDRLFDLMMARFEALRPYRPAVKSMLAATPADPVGAVLLLPTYLTSMAWMLEGAGISSTGLRGIVRAQGLAALNLAVARIWLKDESEDLGPTMAALDAWLTRAEWLQQGKLADAFRACCRRSRDGNKEAVAPLAEDLAS